MDKIEEYTRPSVLVLGSTGSVGTQALDVTTRLGFHVDGICAHRQLDLVEAQARAHGVRACAMTDPDAAKMLKIKLADTDIKVYSGVDGLLHMIEESPSYLVLNAIIGKAGLAPTLATLESGKQLALANKESLVVAGEIVMATAKRKEITIRPVDSEHCAIAQCLASGYPSEVKRLILTASGGPFFGKKREELSAVRAEDALAHPTWRMGAKITIDSATMMNKGFEIIEAAHLFHMNERDIDVIVHRESIIHSMVEYIDRSMIAQMSVPDMRHCIQHALTYPDRVGSMIEPLSLTAVGSLSFASPDEETFSLLRLSRQCIRAGGAMPAVLNAANEVAVAAFLENRIGFCDIFDAVEETVNALAQAKSVHTLSEILEYDRLARIRTEQWISTNRL